MKKRKEKEFKIRTYLTGIIWLALACSMIISALLFAFLNHFPAGNAGKYSCDCLAVDF